MDNLDWESNSDRFTSKRIWLRRLQLNDAKSLLELRLQNRQFLQPWEPVFPETHFTLEGQLQNLQRADDNWQGKTGYAFGIFHAASGDLIGRVTLSNVVYGAWESCTIGYFLDQSHNGNGYMTEAVSLAVQFALTTAGLHRVQAAVMPRNTGSIRVVEKTGFQYEGHAPYYLKINGVWEHHNIYSMTRESWATDGAVTKSSP